MTEPFNLTLKKTLLISTNSSKLSPSHSLCVGAQRTLLALGRALVVSVVSRGTLSAGGVGVLTEAATVAALPQEPQGHIGGGRGWRADQAAVAGGAVAVTAVWRGLNVGGEIAGL